MSDVTDLFEGRLSPIQFVEKEWANATHLVANLPAEVKPLGQALLGDAQAVLSAAEGWTGTAVAAYISAQGANLQTEVLNLLSGMGLGASGKAAEQDAYTAAMKLLLALVANTVVSFQNANAPAAPAPAGEGA